MNDPYALERRALVNAVTQGAGHLSPEVRTAIVDRARGQATDGVVPAALVGFVDRVAEDAPEIGDADVDAVKAAGFDEEAVFEAIVAAALGASLARLEAVDVLLMGRG
jgi:alkylhydroperoxidase family enzyme